jgi:hypothetical protein
MPITRRFVFRGNASPIGGWISHPRHVIIDSPGASSLTVAGGRSQGSLGRRKFDEFASVRSAETSAQGVFDDRRQVRALVLAGASLEALTTTTTVKVAVDGLAIARDPQLRIAELRATMTGASPRADGGEPSIRPGSIRIAGISIGGHTLLVDFNTRIFADYGTHKEFRKAAADPAFASSHPGIYLESAAATGQPALSTSGDTIYTAIATNLRWKKGEDYPNSSIDRNVVVAPGFGKVYFGELLVTPFSRRLTLVRAVLGSPDGGEVACAEIETNGAWYP